MIFDLMIHDDEILHGALIEALEKYIETGKNIPAYGEWSSADPPKLSLADSYTSSLIADAISELESEIDDYCFQKKLILRQQGSLAKMIWRAINDDDESTLKKWALATLKEARRIEQEKYPGSLETIYDENGEEVCPF